MDVGSWLRSLGLGQYRPRFGTTRNGRGSCLNSATVTSRSLAYSSGTRKRLLKAIAELASADRQDCAKPTSLAPSLSPAAAERRPITVMFCDLVGSTSLAAKLDAEDWRNLVNAYLDEASKAVTDLGGHVLKKLGDGLMALFGYPQAQENDAERAVRAALFTLRSEARACRNQRPETPAKAPQNCQARIGLDSGQVVVDATGEVFGEAPNVCRARVQGAAEPGSILITAERSNGRPLPDCLSWRSRPRPTRAQGRVGSPSRSIASSARQRRRPKGGGARRG